MRELIAGLLLILVAGIRPISGQQTTNSQDRQIGSAIGPGSDAAIRSHAYAEELRKENRLPEWVGYVCFQDATNMNTGLFVLMGYQPVTSDFFFHDGKSAKAFGYSRGLTFQEYLGSDTGVTTMNMPISPEAFAEELPKAMQSGKISMAAIELLNAQRVAFQNAIAIAKSTRQSVAKFPTLERDFLKDEEAQALLDAPDGTNYHNFEDKHPGYLPSLLHRQKYYDAGIIDPKGGFTIYREGKVIFEDDFGSNVFQSAGDDGRVGGEGKSATSGLAVRIQMEDTASGLRFVQTHSLGGSGIGIPIVGKCDLIPKP